MPRILLCTTIIIFLFTRPSTAQKLTIKTEQLSDRVYMFTSYMVFNNQSVGCNGMYVIAENGVVLVDTPADEDQTLQLLDTIQMKHNKKVIFCLVSHYHNDSNAGLDILKERGVETWSSKLTNKLASAHNEKLADHLFENDNISLKKNTYLHSPYVNNFCFSRFSAFIIY